MQHICRPAEPPRLRGRTACAGIMASPFIRVLIVDDDRDAAICLKTLLEAAGCEVRGAVMPSNAVAIGWELQPDAALVDIIMPGSNGYRVIRQLRLEFPEMTIVAYSGWGRQEDEDAAVAAGADRFLSKPATFDQIRQALLAGRCATAM
jgi:CheY-like chemotaxis protein